MHAPHTLPSPADLATEVSGLLTGLGILTMALFPFALPGLFLGLLLVLPAAPLVLAGALVWLLARVLAAPFKLVHALARKRVRGRLPADDLRLVAS